MELLGFVPGYLVFLLRKFMGMLRVPCEAEIMGLAKAKVPALAYPEILGETHSPTTPTQRTAIRET